MERTTVLQKVKEIIEDKNHIDISGFKDDSKLRDDLGLDSLDEVELVMVCEMEYNISISNEKWNDNDQMTIGGFTDMVLKIIEEK